MPPMSWKLVKLDEFGFWYDLFGDPGATMIRRIILNSRGHPFKSTKILLSKDYSCETCSQEKLIVQLSMTKIDIESSSFLQRNQGNIYGPIHPASGPLRYFMVLVEQMVPCFQVIHAQCHFCTFICANNKAPCTFF